MGNLDGSGWSLGVDAATFGATYQSGVAQRVDVAAIAPEGAEWHFVAAVFRDADLAAMYVGPRGGALRWMAIRSDAVGALSSPQDLRIGPIAGDVDDLAMWSRALGHARVLELFAGVEVETTR